MSDPYVPATSVPALYARWLDEVLAAPLPDSTGATCADCSMCQKADGRKVLAGYAFDDSVRCCSYMPQLPNFLAGRILSDTSADMDAGRESILARIRQLRSVTPLGIYRPMEFMLPFRGSPYSYGRARELRCPYFVEASKRCSIWRHRNSVCIAWFCKFDRGAAGKQIWQSVDQLLSAIETDLSLWCLNTMDVEVDILPALIPPRGAHESADFIATEEPIGVSNPLTYRVRWGSWFGREVAFFQACGEAVGGLSWKDVLDVCGPEVKLLARQLRAQSSAYGSRVIPTQLRPGSVSVVEVGPQNSRVYTYSHFDMHEVPNALLAALPHFDGRPTDQVLKSIAETNGLTVTEETIRHLVDIGLLG